MKPIRQIAFITLVSSFIGLIGYIPVRTAIAKRQAPKPQAIVVLGGTPDREHRAARIAQLKPNLDIWISSGTSEAAQIFNQAGIERSRIHFDRRATDTITNFTTLIDPLEQRKIQHVYLVTSDFHMNRASAIATVIFGSQGIAFTPISVRNPYYPPESNLRTLRDVGRAFVWLVTGKTGNPLQ